MIRKPGIHEDKNHQDLPFLASWLPDFTFMTFARHGVARPKTKAGASSMIRRRDWIVRPVLHPWHASKKPRRCQPKAFRKTVHLHRLLGINRAGGIETATDVTPAPGLEEKPVALDDDGFVENHRDLFARRPHPIAQHRSREENRCSPENPAAPLVYGWPQCGQTARPSRRFFWQCEHGTRLPFGRVTRWMTSPSHHVGGIQVRSVTS